MDSEQERRNYLHGEIQRLKAENQTLREQADKMLDMMLDAGSTDGGHHKQWYIDQLVRLLTGDDYIDTIKGFYWDEGIAP